MTVSISATSGLPWALEMALETLPGGLKLGVTRRLQPKPGLCYTDGCVVCRSKMRGACILPQGKRGSGAEA